MRDWVVGVLLRSKRDSGHFKYQGRVPHPSAKVKEENETGTSSVLLYFWSPLSQGSRDAEEKADRWDLALLQLRHPTRRATLRSKSEAIQMNLAITVRSNRELVRAGVAAGEITGFRWIWWTERLEGAWSVQKAVRRTQMELVETKIVRTSSLLQRAQGQLWDKTDSTVLSPRQESRKSHSQFSQQPLLKETLVSSPTKCQGKLSNPNSLQMTLHWNEPSWEAESPNILS